MPIYIYKEGTGRRDGLTKTVLPRWGTGAATSALWRRTKVGGAAVVGDHIDWSELRDGRGDDTLCGGVVHWQRGMSLDGVMPPVTPPPPAAALSPPLPRRPGNRSPATASKASACFHTSGCTRLIRRENVLRLQEPKNEQRRLKEREASPPSRASED